MISAKETGFGRAEILAMVKDSLADKEKLSRVLLLPPDYTRMYSGAGMLTAMYYRLLTADACEVDVMPALGTHVPMTPEEAGIFF
jgi:nickel-dependent lactate racemase